jgi:adenine phosphoribosyltransferase
MSRATTERVRLAERLAGRIRVVPDFPRAGIDFQDLSGVFARAELLKAIAAEMAAAFEGAFDGILAVEARGFVLGTAVSMETGIPLFLARKSGKLPGPTHTISYDLEYGQAELEIQQDALPAGGRILIVDDVLATGGTFAAASELVAQAGARTIGYAVALTIAALGGEQRLRPIPVFTVHSIG